MHTLLYAVIAGLAAALPLRMWGEDRADALRRAFVALGVNLAITYAGFGLYLIPGLSFFGLVYFIAAAFLPLTALGFVYQMFPREGAGTGRALRRLRLLSPLIAALAVLGELTIFQGQPRASVGAVCLGVYVFGGVAYAEYHLYRVYQDSTDRVKRGRIRYLLVLLGGAILFSAIEATARGLVAPPPTQTLNLFTGGMALQGAFPPIGVLFTGALVFFLHQVLALYRLLDLHEIFSRVVTLAICGFLLVVVDGVFVLWAGGLALYPVHGTFQIFLASVLFLAAYEPLRRRVESGIGAWFASAERISETVAELREQLPRILDAKDVPAVIVDALVGSGRIVFSSVYLWDPNKRKIRLTISRGPADPPPLAAISPSAVHHEPGKPPSSLHRSALERISRRRGGNAEYAQQSLRLLDGLRVDALIPIAMDELTLGWLGVRQEAWSDGFAYEEIQHLERGMRTTAIVLDNLRGFEALKEQHRLAALGTMAAGLAHEIRNPLAGIKGAAQYLREDHDPEENTQFLHLIVDEIDRLNVVVSQFLDYARPFEIHASPMAINEVIERVVELTSKQDHEGVTIEMELERPLPTLHADRNKLAQVVLNLVQNAIQAIEPGGTIRIRSRSGRVASAEGSYRACIQVSVEDDGRGISREDLDQLFVPFFTTRASGTGLGLPICQRIVQAHGGDIRVRTRPNEGSRFIVTLPLSEPVSPPEIAFGNDVDLPVQSTEEVVPGTASTLPLLDETGELTGERA